MSSDPLRAAPTMRADGQLVGLPKTKMLLRAVRRLFRAL